MAAPPRQLPIPRPLILTGNLTTNWKVLKRDWNNYEIASKLRSETKEIRVATLLSCIGRDAMDILDGFQLTEEQNNDMQEILDAFEKYCIEETNESYERFVFNSRTQQEGESVDKYVAELRKLAKTCNFATLEESFIRDRIITGIKCDITRRKFLQETNLTLIKCIDICRSIESSKRQMLTIQSEKRTDEQSVRKVTAPRQEAYITDTDESFDDAWLAAVSSGSPRSTALLSVIGQEVRFQLDTAADVNTICQKYVRRDQVQPSSQRLIMWNGTKMIPKGETVLQVFNPKIATTHDVRFTVVQNQFTCLLGLETVKGLKFVTINDDKFISKLETWRSGRGTSLG
ncbi:retrovirus-related Pol polyprotein from transposon 17.6 [Elysia marginata]|uniref:Retrovirus-related Pol polyprotein from transposon 17.6 n=1 Tax=Elysia marginata TaxID=1093978 RepID=A0AAV4HI39_9GAST|nr:retrovirus-related Pol polyprotein from transposon 17.6 [Elysia marginata]